MKPTRLFIIDPHDLSRSGLELLVTRSQAPITLVGVYATLDEARLPLRQNHPHVLLLDDSLSHKIDIHETINQFCEQYPGLSILVMSSHLSAHYLQGLLQSGAMGFIYREDLVEASLIVGIELVRSGEFYVSPRASGLLFADRAIFTSDKLNQNDLDVLRLLARGFTAKEIASQLKMVRRSVYRIRSKLRSVLNVRTNEQIVQTARERGLLPK